MYVNISPVNVFSVSFQDIRKQEWTAIIPNSQLIVIPFPHNKPRRYTNTILLHNAVKTHQNCSQ